MDSLAQQIADYQNKFYAENGKNTFFKKAQKQQCAQIVCENIGFEQLLQKTVYIIPNTSYVYFDYTIFKTYATPAHYATIVDYVYKLANHCIQITGCYEVHINLLGFTISACERYKEMITLFCTHCTSENLPCIERITKLHIFNCPSVIDQIANMVKPMIEQSIYNKTVLHPKSEGLPNYTKN
jgi:hypothetical protein